MSKGEATEERDDTETADETSGEDEGSDTPTVEEPRPAPLPRAKRAPTVSAAQAGTPVTAFGAVPKDVTHWRVRRQTIRGFEQVGWAPHGAIAEIKEFPLAELSEQTLSDRWGEGLYEISWVRHLADGGRNVLRGTCEMRILARQVAPPPVEHRPTATDEHLAFMGIVEQRAKSQMSDVLELARFFSTMHQQPAQQGLSLDGLRLLLREERDAAAAATAAAIKAAVEPLQKQIEELSEEDDDDDDGPIADAARAVAPAIFKGKGFWSQLGQFAMQNPGAVEKVLPVVVGAVQQVAGVVASAVTPPQPPPRARAVLVEAPPPPSPVVEVREVVPPAPVAPVAPVVEAEPPVSTVTPSDSAAAAQ